MARLSWGEGRPCFPSLARSEGGETSTIGTLALWGHPLPRLRELILGLLPQLCCTSLSWREERESERRKKECWKKRPCRLEGFEVLGTLAKPSPIKGLWGLLETLRVAQVMSPSKGGPSWPNFEVKGEARSDKFQRGWPVIYLLVSS